MLSLSHHAERAISSNAICCCRCTPEHMCCCLQLGLKFPKPGAEAAHQHVIDLSLHPEASLMTAQGHTFPLIIRLETITEDGAKADHSLQVSTPATVVSQGASTSRAMLFAGCCIHCRGWHAQPCIAKNWRPLSGCHMGEALSV